MSTHAEEIAYYSSRIERSRALAAASTSTAARASHVGIAKAYEGRLAALTAAIPPAEPGTFGSLPSKDQRDDRVGDRD